MCEAGHARPNFFILDEQIGHPCLLNAREQPTPVDVATSEFVMIKTYGMPRSVSCISRAFFTPSCVAGVRVFRYLAILSLHLILCE
jgi:hypothetical protein